MSSFRWVTALIIAALFTTTALAQGVTAAPQSARPQQAVKPATAQVTGTITETSSQAATNPARFDCTGPFAVTFTRVQGAGAPMVYDFTIEFVGAATARDAGPGKCWRQRGWDFVGPSLSRDRKGVLIYRVDMGKCPFLESLTVDAGKITKYKTSERFMGSTWFDQAIRGGGAFTVDTKYIGTTSSTAPVPYSVFVSADTATRAATCTP